MAGRGSQTFKKRQKEQQRKEKQQQKLERKLQRKSNPESTENDGGDSSQPFEEGLAGGVQEMSDAGPIRE